MLWIIFKTEAQIDYLQRYGGACIDSIIVAWVVAPSAAFVGDHFHSPWMARTRYDLPIDSQRFADMSVECIALEPIYVHRAIGWPKRDSLPEWFTMILDTVHYKTQYREFDAVVARYLAEHEADRAEWARWIRYRGLLPVDRDWSAEVGTDQLRKLFNPVSGPSSL